MYIATDEGTPCQQYSPEMWFAKQDTVAARKAKALCYECPERRQCLDSVVRYEGKQGSTEAGIYGGLDPHERAVFLQLPDVQISA
jgi:hypothetical protein